MKVMNKYLISLIVLIISWTCLEVNGYADNQNPYFSILVGEKKLLESGKKILDVQKVITKAETKADAKKFEALRKNELEKAEYKIVQSKVIRNEIYDKVFAESTVAPNGKYRANIDTRLWDMTDEVSK